MNPTTRRARLGVHLLESRLVPSVTASSRGGNLTITGTPDSVSRDGDTGWNDQLAVVRVTGDSYRVTDGSKVVGTFSGTKNISLKLSSIDNDVVVDLAGGALKGDLTIDLGAGDRDRFTRNTIAVSGGRIDGSVAYSGSAANESFVIGSAIVRDSESYDDGEGNILTCYYTYTAASPVVVGKDVAASGLPVTRPYEDAFQLTAGSTVGRDVTTQRITYTRVGGIVGRDVTALTTDSPGGMGLSVSGTVGRDVYAVGAATATFYSSYAFVTGTVGRDVQVRIDTGFCSLDASGVVGRDLSFEAPIGGVSLNAAVGRDVTLRFDGPTGSNSVRAAGTVGRDLSVNSGAGKLTAQFGIQDQVYDPDTDTVSTVSRPLVVGRNLSVTAAGATNAVALNGDYGLTVGGTVRYTGGSGTDTLSITGHNAFSLVARMGGGDAVVTFAPDARVGRARIEFGAAGTHKLVLPDDVDFPLVVLQ